MCAIAGIIGAGSDLVADMQRMLDALRHRGPDGEGMQHAGQAIFGHRRLSIIDLAGGRQPLLNHDASVWLVCNGEIYNYVELRAQLQARGYRFQTNSDCEVILALYEFHGDRLLEYLRGMFAFALWDTRKQRLLVARDHLGQKPLYYSTRPGRFAFASEIKGVLALDSSLRQLNLAALDQYLGLRLVAPPNSMFAGIHKLPPGHLLVLEDQQAPRIQSYWDLRYQPKLSGTLDELTDQLEERIAESLQLCRVSDVPVGAFLSGGLDSGLLVAMLARKLGVRDLDTFTLGLPYEQFDEAPHARAVARLYGTRHHEETLASSLVTVLPDLILHLDEPSDPLSLCAYQVAALARQHVKVVIGGDGGDELFGGYDRYYGNLYADHYARIPAPLRRYLAGPALNLLPTIGWYKSKGHQMKWLHRLSFMQGAERYAASLTYFYFESAARRALFSPAAIAELSQLRAERAIEVPFDAVTGDHLDRMLYADSKVRLPDHPVMISDRMTMAHGLEARSPFMDHKLAEFAASLPSPVKVKGRSLRVIQRHLAARYLPQEILDRPKQGFSSALPYLLHKEYRFLYDRFLTRSELVGAGYLNQSAIDSLLREQMTGRTDHGTRLWLLINAELWYRMMIQGVSRDSLRTEMAEFRRGLAA